MTEPTEQTGDAVDRLLSQIERAAEIDAANNYRIMDNHLLHADRVIAGVAALQTAREDSVSLAKELLGNPT